MRAALRRGAAALAILLFLLSSDALANEPAGSPSDSKPWRPPMTFNAACSTPRRVDALRAFYAFIRSTGANNRFATGFEAS